MIKHTSLFADSTHQLLHLASFHPIIRLTESLNPNFSILSGSVPNFWDYCAASSTLICVLRRRSVRLIFAVVLRISSLLLVLLWFVINFFLFHNFSDDDDDDDYDNETTIIRSKINCFATFFVILASYSRRLLNICAI